MKLTEYDQLIEKLRKEKPTLDEIRDIHASLVDLHKVLDTSHDPGYDGVPKEHLIYNLMGAYLDHLTIQTNNKESVNITKTYEVFRTILTKLIERVDPTPHQEQEWRISRYRTQIIQNPIRKIDFDKIWEDTEKERLQELEKIKTTKKQKTTTLPRERTALIALHNALNTYAELHRRNDAVIRLLPVSFIKEGEITGKKIKKWYKE